MAPELSLAQDSMEGFTAVFEELVLLLLDRLRRSDPKGQWDSLRLPSTVDSRSLSSALALAPDQVLLALRREVDEAIATAREMHNASVQINALPHEIMSKIFRMDLEGMLPRRDKRRLGTAALVCRRWNRVALETPSLWSQWDQNDGLGYFKRAQGLSGATGLTISCTLSETELWEVVNHERRRWEDVTFEVQNMSGSLLHALEELGTRTAPKLRKLRISAPSWHRLPRLLTMFATADPCPLEELRLSRISIDWDTVNFCGLRVLEVGRLPRFGPTVQQLLEILARCNQLQRLTLAGVALSQNPELHPLPLPILLPSLSILELRCGDDEASDIVSGISLPSCKELRVSGFNWGRLSRKRSLPILDVIENIIRLGSTTVLFREDSVYLEKSDHTLRVRFRADPRDAFRWLVTVAGPVLNSAPSITLVSEINFDYESSMDILSTSSQLRNTTALTFRAGSHRMEQSYFPDCLANLGDQISHLFPRLQEIFVLLSTISEVESLRNFAARSCAEGMQIRVIHVHSTDTNLLLSKCRDLFQEISAYLPGGQLRVANKLWQAGIDST